MLQDEGYLDRNNFIYKKMKENTGGAGGFYTGLSIAAEESFDWVWVMDDDTIPEKECLYELIEAYKKIKTTITIV